MFVSHWILKDGLSCVLQQERFLRSVSLSEAGFKNLFFFYKRFIFIFIFFYKSHKRLNALRTKNTMFSKWRMHNPDNSS